MKQDRRVVKTKLAIKEALVSLVSEEGAQKITISALAERANIDRKTFYLHYESINDVVREMSRERLADFKETLTGANYFDGSVNIPSLITALNEAIGNDLDIYKQIVRHPEYDFFWDEIRLAIKESFIAMHAKTLEISKKQLELCAEYFVSGTVSVYIKWLRGELEVSLDELLITIASLNFSGFGQFLKPTPKTILEPSSL